LTAKGVLGAVTAAIVLGAPLGFSIPDPNVCGPTWLHNYDFYDGSHGTVVYDQCAAHDIPESPTYDIHDEYAAGIGGAAFASVTDNGYGGGVENCWDSRATGHHGLDDTINTMDFAEGGNVRVFIAADIEGGDLPDTVTSPCGDGIVGPDDQFDVSEPCGLAVHGGITPACPVNSWRCSWGATLAECAGLDGVVWTFLGVSAGNASEPTSGLSWTSSSGLSPSGSPSGCSSTISQGATAGNMAIILPGSRDHIVRINPCWTSTT
jgi:hypothetical protein